MNEYNPMPYFTEKRVKEGVKMRKISLSSVLDKTYNELFKKAKINSFIGRLDLTFENKMFIMYVDMKVNEGGLRYIPSEFRVEKSLNYLGIKVICPFGCN